MIQIDTEEDRQARWKSLLTKTEPTPMPIESPQDNRQQRWQSLLTKAPQEEQRTWGDDLARSMEGAEKLFTGKLGVKIGGKTLIEHFGEFVKPVTEEAVGIGEGAMAGAGEYAMFIPALIAGVGAKALGKSFVESEEIRRKITELMTREPTTEKGETYREVITSPLALFGAGMEHVTEGMDAETEAAVRLGSGVVLAVAGASLHGSAKAYVESAAQKGGAAIARAKTLIRKSKDVPPEIKTIVEKIPELPPELKPTKEQIVEQKMIHEQAGTALQETLGKQLRELKGEKPTLPEVKPTPSKSLYKKGDTLYKGKDKYTVAEVIETESFKPGEPSYEYKVITPQGRLLHEYEVDLKAYSKKPLKVERDIWQEGKDLLKELEVDLTEKHSGFNLFDEFKKSAEYLKTGKVPITAPTKRMKGKAVKPIPPPEVTPMELPAIQKVLNAIKEADPKRAEQETLYTAERGKRLAMSQQVAKKTAGEAGFIAERAKLGGELPKVQFESIRKKLTQSDIDSMFDQVKTSPILTEWEKFPAREGLAKLFGEHGGKLPTEGELALLNQVFPKKFTKALLKKRDLWTRVKAGMLEASGIPRALMSSFDLSFGFRQGVFLGPRYPKQFGAAFLKQFKMFGSEKAYQALKQEIASRPTYKLMRRSKLALTEMDYTLAAREEGFMSHWAEKVPLVRASGRAYSGMANKIRADVFDLLVKKAEKVGLNPQKDARLSKAIADFVNNGSGRGSLRMLENSAVTLNQLFFSPRLVWSRLKLLNPVWYAKLPPFVRKQALQSLLAFTSAGTAILTAVKLGGGEVGTNPLSADFGKIKVGDTRVDIWGGFQQYVRTAAQFVAGKTVSATTGKETKVGEGYKPLTRLEMLGRWAEYKQAPVFSFATDLLRGSTAFGEPLDFGTTDLTKNPIAQRFIPMVMQDLWDITRDDPGALPVSPLGFFGVGLQTYQPRPKGGKSFSLGY